MPKINLAFQSYAGNSRPLSSEKLINLYPEIAPPEAKTNVSLVSVPGNKAFAEVGDGPIYGIKQMGGELYVVSGTEAYRVKGDGTSILLGSVGFVGAPVSMAENGLQVAIIKPDGAGFIATSGGVVPITDPDYEPSNSVTYLDTYFIFGKLDGKIYFISAPNDGTNIPAGQQGSAEAGPDNIVAVKAYNQSLWIFGETTTEIHYDSGDVDFPFQPIRGALIERGCAAPLSVAADNNVLLWLGDDKVVYQAQGYQQKRVSNHGIEQQINKLAVVSDALGYFYNFEGHYFYDLTFPNGGLTVSFDLNTGLWHNKESYMDGRWRANNVEKAFGKQLVADFESNNVWEIDRETFTDGDEPLRRGIVSAPVFFDKKRFSNNWLELDIDSGVGTISGQGVDPKAVLRFSDDGGNTWSYEKIRGYGKIGQYRHRLIWRRLGLARERVYEIIISDPTKVTVNGAYAQIDVGIE